MLYVHKVSIKVMFSNNVDGVEKNSIDIILGIDDIISMGFR
jgi:hypothetical protein